MMMIEPGQRRSARDLNRFTTEPQRVGGTER
jgi:hypothetical protein